MSIRKVKGEFVAECSECGEEYPGGVEEDFRQFVQLLKDDGWWVRKVEDSWEHVCPGCASEMRS